MKKIRLFSMIAFLVLIAVSILFMVFVFRSQLIPSRILVIAIILYLFVLCLLAMLVFRTKHQFLVILGGALSLLLCVLLLVSTMYFNRAINAAQSITTTKTEVSTISVFMLNEKTDDSTVLTSDLTYGILKERDRENTDAVIEKLEKELNASLKIQEFDSISGLIDALIAQDVDAIILNSAYLNILNETEGYEHVKSQLREILKTQVVAEVKESAPKSTSSPSSLLDLLPKEKNKDDCFVVYFSGIDTRGKKLIEKSRSDVNVLAVINPTTHQILLLTTPRDYYVTLQLPDGPSYIKDKLTHAGIYGVQVSMDTLGLLYDIDVDYYFRVNFSGFVDIVDAMGGITVDSETEFWEKSGYTIYHFTEGPNNMDGKTALAFVRARQSIGDQQRGRNHMSFIKAVINKATSTDILLHFDEILSSVEGSFDTSVPYDLISNLIREQIEKDPDWNIVSYNVSGTGNSAMTYSADIPLFVFIPDMSTVDTAKALIQQVLNGEVIVEPEPTPRPW